MPAERKYVVDRIEGELVVLVDDESGDRANLESWELPVVDEGTVLAVETDANGHPKWGTATVLAEETEKRRHEDKTRIEDLKRRDPGGDVTI